MESQHDVIETLPLVLTLCMGGISFKVGLWQNVQISGKNNLDMMTASLNTNYIFG